MNASKQEAYKAINTLEILILYTDEINPQHLRADFQILLHEVKAFLDVALIKLPNESTYTKERLSNKNT